MNDGTMVVLGSVKKDCGQIQKLWMDYSRKSCQRFSLCGLGEDTQFCGSQRAIADDLDEMIEWRPGCGSQVRIGD
jgi:hypothetical protein